MEEFVMEVLLDECQEAFPDQKIPGNILTKIYYGAKMDLAKTLVAALNDLPSREMCNYLLNVKFEEKDGQSVTPLVLAAKSGNTNFVRTLLSHYDLDTEIECNVIFDGIVVYGATALWVAAGMGHLNIVKFLVQKGADLNHKTKAHSSPLRAACYEGRLDIVRYLIEHGADVNLANTWNNTCIMIAAYKGHLLVVDTLLKKGADPNEKALCGGTALHYAAECGYLEICQLLLDHGAKIQKNEDGLTPVLHAAERSHENIVEMFINRPGLMNKEEKIEALELMGASFANDKDNYSVVKAFQYMMNGMELRFQDPDNIIRKRTIQPVPAYDNWIETETIEDLQAIRLNHHSIHMESLTVRERILGKRHPDLPQPIVYRGAVFADQERFDMCCNLWNYAIDLRMATDLSVERDLLRFAQLFSQMVRLEQNLDICVAISVLSKCQQEIANNQRKMANPGPKDSVPRILDEYDSNIITALYLIKIITILLNNKTRVGIQQVELLYTSISNLIRMNAKIRDGQTLLHRAVNGVTPPDDFYTNEICRFPCYKTALLLVHVGAPVNAEDLERNTPLHVLISSIRRDNTLVINQAEKIIKLFTEAGAHLDAVNSLGLTPAQLASVSSLSNMMAIYQNKSITLKCLAARSIAFYKLKYKNNIPKSLENFIQIHSADKPEV
ncbi:protein fem-1 homolog B [Episyrphus balteatus]|uniref:protein fem-1 homolog B n=1 Tax=Episyrphus balteatus TaxID=286459 RepID=UPI0024868A0D|nr:protein fem-1 homolog B [Episyrphus balteatus]